jgi:hypothetical protein
MKYLVAILCLLATSTIFGQNQTLMVNANFTVIQTNTNPLVFQSPIGFGTNTTFQARSRTNLGMTVIGDSLATATNATNAQTAIGISATNTISVSNIDIGVFGAGSSTGFVGRTTDGTLILRGTNVSTATPALFGWTGFDATALSATTAQAALFPSTNAAPASTTSVVGWVDLRVGTNTFKLPLYQ